jgi:predicted acetyltransferase
MIEEWKSFEATPTSPSRLFAGESYEEFLSIIEQDIINSPRWVNSTLFFCMDDDTILWAIQIRHHIDNLYLSLDWGCGGHIGYWLRPSARGQWLSKEMLRLGLIEANKLGIEKVLISAHEDNIASWKTIESCGGEYIKTIRDGGKNLKVYWINTY